MKLLPVIPPLGTALRFPIHASRKSITCLATTTLHCHLSQNQTSSFSTTPSTLARKGDKGPAKDRRISPLTLPVNPIPPLKPSLTLPSLIELINYFLHHPRTPRPLRLSRNRTLRHWTIHRAAQLLLHNERAKRELELERQYNAMRAAMEELRLGAGDGGRLYRQAVSRKGIYGGLKVGQMGGLVGNGGIPAEYARAQTEGPPRAGWDHGWTRG